MAPDSLPALVSTLKTGDSNIRLQTLNYCNSFGYRKKDMVPGLIACLKDSNINVRQSACASASDFGR